MELLRYFLPALLTLCASAQQGTLLHVRGHIRDATTHNDVAGVTVSAIEARHNATTDMNGSFSLELRDGVEPGDDVRIHIEKKGYSADDVTEAASEKVIYAIQILHLADGQSTEQTRSKEHRSTPPQSRPTPTPAQPTYSVTNPSGTIVNQNSPNYGEQTITIVPPSRLLDDEHAMKFRAALVGTKGSIILFTGGTDSDVVPLASQLCGLFQEAWHGVNCIGVPGSPALFSPPIKLPTHLVGLHCCGINAAAQKALNDSGLECTYEAGRLGEGGSFTVANAIAIGNAK